MRIAESDKPEAPFALSNQRATWIFVVFVKIKNLMKIHMFHNGTYELATFETHPIVAVREYIRALQK